MDIRIVNQGGGDVDIKRRVETADTIYKLLQAQGEIHPGWNDEFLEARWVRSIAREAMAKLGFPLDENDHSDILHGRKEETRR